MRPLIRFLRIFWKAFERTAVQVMIVALIVISILAIHVGIGPLDVLLLLTFSAWLSINFLYYRNKELRILKESSLWEGLFEEKPKTQRDKVLEILEQTGREFRMSDLASVLGIDPRNLPRIVKPLLRKGLVRVRKQGKEVYISATYSSRSSSLSSSSSLYEMTIEVPKVDLRKVPNQGVPIGKFVSNDFKVLKLSSYFDGKQLLLGFIVTGVIGSGKTYSAKAIVKEISRKGITALVLDPTGQWRDMTKHILSLKEVHEGVRIEVLGKLRKNDIFVIDLSGIVSDVEKVLATCLVLREIHSHFIKQEDSEEIRLFIVIEEAHHFLREYIPEVPKSAITILGKSIRELRKKGVGFLVISHKVSDFEGNIRASINTKIYMRTGYEPDLQRIKSFHGSSYAKVVEKLPVGFAMIHYADHNHGRPYFIKFKEYKVNI